MSPSRASRLSQERGSALPFALLAIIVLAGLISTMLATAVAEQRVTGRAQSYEAAVHVAEAGTDRVIEQINADVAGEWVSGDVDGLSYVYPNPAPADEEAWAIGLFEDAVAVDSSELVLTSEGVSLGIRPRDAWGAPMDVIFGVGRTAAGAPAERTRVIRLEFDRGFFSPAHAVCTNGLLTSSGVDIDGLSGSVHSNTGVSLSGSGSISGALTSATGVYDPGGYVIGVLSQSGPNKPYKDCGPIDARRIYTARATYLADGHLQDVSPADGIADDWWDLCADGKVRHWTPVGSHEPCNGEIVMDDASMTVFNGWRFQAGEWRLVGNEPFPGVYYAHQKNVQINGSPDAMSGVPEQYTIISEATVQCTPGNMDSGTIKMGGNAKLTPRLPNLLFIADVDLEVNGTSGAQLNGYMGANEQVLVMGNFALNGSVAADEECDPSGTPVSDNKISGSVTITYNGGTPVLLPGAVRITAWNEL